MDTLAALVRDGPRAVWTRLLRLLAFLRLGEAFRRFRVPLNEWPPTPATIRRCAPALVLVLFVPKFAVDLCRLFSAVAPDQRKITTNARKFVTASRKALAAVKRANEALPLCREASQAVHEEFAPTQRPEVWRVVSAAECAANRERFADAVARLGAVNEPEFLGKVPLSSFDLLVQRKVAEKKKAKEEAEAAAAAAQKKAAASSTAAAAAAPTPASSSASPSAAAAAAPKVIMSSGGDGVGGGSGGGGGDGGGGDDDDDDDDDAPALRTVGEVLPTHTASSPGDGADDLSGGVDGGGDDDYDGGGEEGEEGSYYSDDDGRSGDDDDDDADAQHGTTREQEINERHAEALALLGSIKSAYNDLVDALLEQDTQAKVYDIRADEDQLTQACVASYILLGHGTALCYALFAETVYLTSEGAVEKFKDGQELRTLWSRTISFFLYELRWTVPYAEMRKDPACVPSHDHRQSSRSSPLKSRASPELQAMMRRSLNLLEGMLRQRDAVLRKLKMGDFRKVLRFTKMILGSPRNWLLTGMSWVLTMLTSAVGSSSFHYQNLLISVVKGSLDAADGAAAAAAAAAATATATATATAGASVPVGVYEAAVASAISAVPQAPGRASAMRRWVQRLLLGHGRPPGPAAGAAAGSFGLGKRLAEVLFAVFFMEILQVLLEDLTLKCKNVGLASIEDRLSKKMVRVVLAQDLEEMQRKNKRGGGRSSGPMTPTQLIHDLCEEENGVVGGILDIPLQIISAGSTALTTGLLLWGKNRTLLVVLLALSTGVYRLSNGVRVARDWLGQRLGVNVNDKWESSVAELDLLDGVDNFKDMRVNGNEHYHIDEYHSSKEHTQRTRDRAETLASLFFPLESLVKQVPMLFSYVDVVSVYWLGGWLVLHDALAAGDLANFLDTTRALVRELRESYGLVMELVRLDGPNIRRATAIVDLFEQKPRIGIDGGERLPPGALADGTVEFKNVSFSRPDWPLQQRGISFRVPSGSFVAVCGRNGSGKSTLFGLLLRLYEADAGEIFVGGRNIKDLNPVDLRSRMAMAIQSPGMKMDCIRANCIYGSEKMFEHSNDPALMDTKIHEALEKLDAWNMFSDPKTFPEGIDSYKWELSGGQKRIVGLVRAIVRESRILLLDEPTNDLDPDRQEAVKENLFRRRGSQTVMCITHDISLIREADTIIFLSKDPVTGVTTISEVGTYDELKASGGTFQKWHEFKTSVKQQHSAGADELEHGQGDEEEEGDGEVQEPQQHHGESSHHHHHHQQQHHHHQLHHQHPQQQHHHHHPHVAPGAEAVGDVPLRPIPLVRVRSSNAGRAPQSPPLSPRGPRSPSAHHDHDAGAA